MLLEKLNLEPCKMWRKGSFEWRFIGNRRLILIGCKKGIEILLSFIILFKLIIIRGTFHLLLPLMGFGFLLCRLCLLRLISFFLVFVDDSPPTGIEDNLILSCIPSLVTNVMNYSLIRLTLLPELEEVVFGMNKGKALGLDGFPVKFF